MALPVILVDSATGSDTAASGAGPATALTGSAGVSSASGLSVILDGSPDLSGVATDGSHVLYFADATAGNRNFGKITATANSGTPTAAVTVSDAFGVVLTKAWAIGGKRASIGSTTSLKLIDNNSAAGDAMPGWIIQMASGHSETIAATVNCRRAGDQTTGPIILRGISGAATLPLLTFSNNGVALSVIVAGWVVRDFELRNTNATKTASIAFQITGVNQVAAFIGLKVSHSTNKFWKGFSTGQGNLNIQDCELGYCASHGIENSNASYGFYIANNYIHDCGGSGIAVAGGANEGGVCWGNIVYNCTSHGILLTGLAALGAGNFNNPPQTVVIGNTVDTCGVGSDGIRITGTAGFYGIIANNILSNNGGYGLNFTASTDIALTSFGSFMRGNTFYSNTSGATNPSTLTNNVGSSTSNPTYTAAASGDFSLGTPLKALGYPLGGTLKVGSTSITSSYVDPGAAQRQEPAAGPVGQITGARSIGTY